MPKPIMIVLYGSDSVLMPRVGSFGQFTLRPGVHSVDQGHWDLLVAAEGEAAAPLKFALEQGRIGPAETTKPPVLVTRQVLVPADSEEAQALEIEIPDGKLKSKSKPKKKPAKKKPAKKK